MFTGLMKSWNPSLGSLDPQFENDMKSLNNIDNNTLSDIETFVK